MSGDSGGGGGGSVESSSAADREGDPDHLLCFLVADNDGGGTPNSTVAKVSLPPPPPAPPFCRREQVDALPPRRGSVMFEASPSPASDMKRWLSSESDIDTAEIVLWLRLRFCLFFPLPPGGSGLLSL